MQYEANSIFLYGAIEQYLQLLLNMQATTAPMYSRTFQSLLNLTKSELEIKLVENVGGERVLVKHEAKLEENKGGR